VLLPNRTNCDWLKAFIDEKGTIIPEGAVQLPSLPCPSKIQMAMIFAHF
jgi:hypothetical protein